MPELNKFQIKTFVHDAVHLFRGTAARLAEDYGKSEFWMSDLLNPTSETDGPVYLFLLFMKRLARRSPDAHAMIDDEVRRINDELRDRKVVAVNNESIDDLLDKVNSAHFKLQQAYRNRLGRNEIKAAAAVLAAHNNNLLNALNVESISARREHTG